MTTDIPRAKRNSVTVDTYAVPWPTSEGAKTRPVSGCVIAPASCLVHGANWGPPDPKSLRHLDPAVSCRQLGLVES